MDESQGTGRLMETRRKSYDWKDTKVLAVSIALTLIVKMNCSAVLDLLSCG
jgi:hypothetical protein